MNATVLNREGSGLELQGNPVISISALHRIFEIHRALGRDSYSSHSFCDAVAASSYLRTFRWLKVATANRIRKSNPKSGPRELIRRLHIRSTWRPLARATPPDCAGAMMAYPRVSPRSQQLPRSLETNRCYEELQVSVIKHEIEKSDSPSPSSSHWGSFRRCGKSVDADVFVTLLQEVNYKR